MKYILTGATGYIGSNIAKKLVDDGNEVSIIIRKNSSLKLIEDIKSSLNIFIYNGEIKKMISFFQDTNADVVIHLASLFISEHKVEDVGNLIDSNVKFSTEILEAMNQSSTKKIINTGTSWQHFENGAYNPVCLYAATKEAYEAIIEYYVQAQEITCITLELFDSYGPNDNRPKLLNLLKKYSEEKKGLELSRGEQYMDLVYISDIVQGYVIAIDKLLNKKDKLKEKYVLSSKRKITLKELVELYSYITGKEVLVNWGSREYRKREVMAPWENGIDLPDWSAKISLEEGLKNTFTK